MFMFADHAATKGTGAAMVNKLATLDIATYQLTPSLVQVYSEAKAINANTSYLISW